MEDEKKPTKAYFFLPLHLVQGFIADDTPSVFQLMRKQTAQRFLFALRFEATLAPAQRARFRQGERSDSQRVLNIKE